MCLASINLLLHLKRILCLDLLNSTKNYNCKIYLRVFISLAAAQRVGHVVTIQPTSCPVDTFDLINSKLLNRWWIWTIVFVVRKKDWILSYRHVNIIRRMYIISSQYNRPKMFKINFLLYLFYNHWLIIGQLDNLFKIRICELN